MIHQWCLHLEKLEEKIELKSRRKYDFEMKIELCSFSIIKKWVKRKWDEEYSGKFSFSLCNQIVSHFPSISKFFHEPNMVLLFYALCSYVFLNLCWQSKQNRKCEAWFTFIEAFCSFFTNLSMFDLVLTSWYVKLKNLIVMIV